MKQRKARLSMDEKDLLDPVNEAAQHDDFREAAPGPKRLDAPFQALPRKALLERLIERLQEVAQALGDRSPNDRADDRMKRVDQKLRALFHRLAHRSLDRWAQRTRQLFASITTEGERFRENFGDFVRALLFVVEPLLQPAQSLLLLPDEKPTQFRQIIRRFSRLRAPHPWVHLLRRAWNAEFLFQAERNFAQHLGERFATGHGVADLAGFVIELALEVIVLFLQLRAQGF